MEDIPILKLFPEKRCSVTIWLFFFWSYYAPNFYNITLSLVICVTMFFKLVLPFFTASYPLVPLFPPTQLRFQGV